MDREGEISVDGEVKGNGNSFSLLSLGFFGKINLFMLC